MHQCAGQTVLHAKLSELLFYLVFTAWSNFFWFANGTRMIFFNAVWREGAYAGS